MAGYLKGKLSLNKEVFMKKLLILGFAALLSGCAHDHYSGGTGTPSDTTTGSSVPPYHTITNDMENLGYAPVGRDPVHAPSNQKPSGARMVPGRSVYIDTY
jgi:hypothetical protein